VIVIMILLMSLFLNLMNVWMFFFGSGCLCLYFG